MKAVWRFLNNYIEQILLFVMISILICSVTLQVFYAHHRKFIFLDGRGCALFLCVVRDDWHELRDEASSAYSHGSYPGAAARKKEELF